MKKIVVVTRDILSWGISLGIFFSGYCTRNRQGLAVQDFQLSSENPRGLNNSDNLWINKLTLWHLSELPSLLRLCHQILITKEL